MLNSLNYDRSVYYTVRDAIEAVGIDPSGIRFIDGDLSDYLIQQAEEGILDLDTFEESVVLPAIVILDDGIVHTPGALGGATWARHAYTVSVYGVDQSYSKEMAEAITRKIKNRISIYDYTMGSPDASGFPASGQLIGSFHVENVRNFRPGVASLSLLDSVRRDVSFEIVPIER